MRDFSHRACGTFHIFLKLKIVRELLRKKNAGCTTTRVGHTGTELYILYTWLTSKLMHEARGARAVSVNFRMHRARAAHAWV
jgi:hypothetical protein